MEITRQEKKELGLKIEISLTIIVTLFGILSYFIKDSYESIKQDVKQNSSKMESLENILIEIRADTQFNAQRNLEMQESLQRMDDKIEKMR